MKRIYVAIVLLLIFALPTVVAVAIDPTTAVLTVSNQFNTVVLTSDGSLWASGDNSFGQLGTGNLISTKPDDFVRMQTAQGPITEIQKVVLGSQFVLVLKKDGTVLGVGLDRFGQLGDGAQGISGSSSGTTHRTLFVHMITETGQPLANIVDIAAGTDHTLMLKQDGTVWVAGSNKFGQLGAGVVSECPKEQFSTIAIQALENNAPLSQVSAIFAEGSYSLVKKTDGATLGVGIGHGSQSEEEIWLLGFMFSPTEVSPSIWTSR